MKLEEKVAIVTGSRRGIGRAIAMALAAEDAAVMVADLDLADCQTVVDDITAAGGIARAVRCDVTSAPEVQEMVAYTIRELGGLDILVNNAAFTIIKPFQRITEEDWDRTMAVNVKGPFLCCQAVARHMIRQNSGRIINISSISGGYSVAFPLMAPYTASKGGLRALTEALAVELAPHGISVNAICPGAVDSGILPDTIRERSLDRIPAGRLGRPEEIAGLVVYLASGAADYINGAAINIDGGWRSA